MRAVTDDRTGDIRVLRFSRRELCDIVRRLCKARGLVLASDFEVEIEVNDEWMVEVHSNEKLARAQ
jgi:hypothetical protein